MQVTLAAALPLGPSLDVPGIRRRSQNGFNGLLANVTSRNPRAKKSELAVRNDELDPFPPPFPIAGAGSRLARRNFRAVNSRRASGSLSSTSRSRSTPSPTTPRPYTCRIEHRKANYPEKKSPNIPSSGFTRLYGRATQALLGIVGSRNASNNADSTRNPSGDNGATTGDGAGGTPGVRRIKGPRSGSNTATKTTSKASKKNMTARGGNQGGSSSTPSTAQPIPIANANSDSTGATTTNPSVNSGLASSLSSSESHEPQPPPIIPNPTSGKKGKKRGVVRLEDIPGTRVGPDDGPWPKEYDILETEEDLWRELRSLARPHRAIFVNYEGHRSASRSRSRGDRSRSHGRSAERVTESPGELLTPVQESPVVDNAIPTSPVAVDERPAVELPRVNVVDSVNFQPCKTLKTQDRYVVTQVEVHGEMWTLTGVFDGHLGDVTVEHVAHHLPIIIREFLKSKLPTDFSSSDYDPELVSDLFQSAIAAFDDAIAHDILDLFGGSVEQLSNYTDAEIRKIINDNHGQGSYGGSRGAASGSGENWRKARLCMYGTTALVALMDPKGEGVWVANLGDCMGILVTRTVTLDGDEDSDSEAAVARMEDPEQGEWTVEVLTTMHNGDNDREIERIKSEHPGEEDTCIMDRRVLGALAPTRCLGDIPFKQPPEFTRRVLYNLYPFVHNTAPWEEFLKYNKTPPYLSSQAEVVYRRIKGDNTDPPSPGPKSDGPPPLGKRRNSGSITAAAVLKRLGSMTAKRGRKAKKQTEVTRVKKQRFLILASDGFTDLCLSRGGVEKVVTSWAKEMVQIGSPRQAVLETEAKLRDRANGVLVEEEQHIPVPMSIPVPRPAFPTHTSSSRFAIGDDESSHTAASPVSATSPVPFTANSFSSSVGSLVIPSVNDPSPEHEDMMSGMSTPAYAFSIPPTRAASPMSHAHAHGATTPSPLSRAQSHVHVSPQIHSRSSAIHQSQSNISAGFNSSDLSSSHLSPNPQLPAAPTATPPTVPVPRLHRPPLPHTNKSFHCTSSSNMALRLLRCALSGEERDIDRVAKAMTIDMDVSWLDDTAIVVVGL